jgi:hypothetical protein
VVFIWHSSDEGDARDYKASEHEHGAEQEDAVRGRVVVRRPWKVLAQAAPHSGVTTPSPPVRIGAKPAEIA